MHRLMLGARARLEGFVINKKVHNEEWGICSNFDLRDIYPFVDRFYETWEHFSGYYKFPVPSSSEKLTPDGCYYHEKYPLYEGEQLEYRVSLAKHLINEIDKKLSEEL